jgi:hypothetical protein
LNFLDRFSKNHQISNLIKTFPVAAELFHADGQTDMTKLKSRFPKFCERAWELFSRITSTVANQEGLKLNGTHQLVVYADDVNILGGSVHAIKKNTEALVVASKQIGLEVNGEKTKYMVMSGDRNVGQQN